MKIILSRKGFDSSVGKVASPILPSGQLCSLPIPDVAGAHRYEQIGFVDDGGATATLGKIVSDLTRGRLTSADKAHLDPDLRRASLPRADDWRPIFGQTGAAQGHLQRQKVSVGDLFLFYGWFRQVAIAAGCFQYVDSAPDLHVLFGWMQVGDVLPVDSERAVPAWAAYHPHVQRTFTRNNTLYIAAADLVLPTIGRVAAGAGVFTYFMHELQLTDAHTTNEKKLRSLWRLPVWCFPRASQPPLTYHADSQRWTRDGNHVLLRTVGRGQEFVLDCAHYPKAETWLQRLMTAAGSERLEVNSEQ